MARWNNQRVLYNKQEDASIRQVSTEFFNQAHVTDQSRWWFQRFLTFHQCIRMRWWHQISHFPFVWDHQSCFMSSFLGNVPSPITRSSRPKSVAWKVWSESSKVDPIIWRLSMIVLQSLAIRWDDCWVFKMLDADVVILARDTVDTLWWTNIAMENHHF